MRLLLVRHAQTTSNVLGALDTAAPGAELTELGHQQAAAAAPVLLARGVSEVHVSPLVRTHQTAAPLARSLGVTPVVHDGLAEIAAGELEMRRDLEALESYATAVLGWLTGDLGRRVGTGPSGHEFLERYDAAVRAIATGSSSAAVAAVSHGAAIRVWVALRVTNPGELGVLAGGVERRQPARLCNTGCIELHGDPGSGWRATSWEGTPLGGAHLEEPDPFGEPAVPGIHRVP